ncbi:MAG: DUF4191 domain-containing protein [Mycobacteriaceae bacterium]|nr:DUF4191 domain-containing protein [Mycobacteriaceae bacterium]
MAGTASTKEAKAAAKAARKQQSRERRSQLWQAFTMQRKEDPLLLPLMIGAVVGIAALFFVVGLLFDWQLVLLVPGLLVGGLVAFAIFARRVQRKAFARADGQPGAAAWVLENMQGKWRVKSAVAGNAQLDAVHRVIGLPGVILVGEGAAQRVKPLMAQEKKRIAKLVGETPIYDVVVGSDEGEVPLAQLQKHIVKLPRNIDTKRMDALESRLAALGARSGPAMPKGPLPAGAKMRSVQRTVRRR